MTLRKKYTFRAGGRKVIFIKKSHESEEHVLAKALTFGLYVSEYPGIKVEVSTGDRFKPDLVAVDREGSPLFWAECGAVRKEKIEKLLKKYKRTHFVFLKFSKEIEQFAAMVGKLMERTGHRSRVDIIKLPRGMADFIRDDGTITVRPEDCEKIVLPRYVRFPEEG